VISMKMIYGLGNPGTKYERTRHNVGFMVVDYLSGKWNIPVKKRKAEALLGLGTVNRFQVMLVKPQTFMNLSGYPLGALGAVVEDLIVIHDDLDIPLGQVRVKMGGGTGGHKGLESIVSVFGSRDFLRIRFGIGRPPEGRDPSDYVLCRFGKEDTDLVQEQIVDAASAVELCIRGEVTKAMNQFNKREKEPAKKEKEN